MNLDNQRAQVAANDRAVAIQYLLSHRWCASFSTGAVNERAGFPFKVHLHMLRHACG
jgi:hypothetical protein